jgi:hypothetical protein
MLASDTAEIAAEGPTAQEIVVGHVAILNFRRTVAFFDSCRGSVDLFRAVLGCRIWNFVVANDLQETWHSARKSGSLVLDVLMVG